MPILAHWWDLRNLGNAASALLDRIEAWGAPAWIPYVVAGVIGIVGCLTFLLLSQLSFIWIERRLVARMQNRIGPNRVGPQGLLQPIADTLKLFLKEAITKRSADRTLFWLVPIVILSPGLVAFAVIPFGDGMVLAKLNVGVLFLIAVGSLNTLIIFMAGWSSDNKYALLGAMRTVAMLISYELVQVLALLGAVLFVGSMNVSDVVGWQSHFHTWLLFLQPLAAMAYIFAGAVEINRTPVDIAEAESEIVAGYHIEYSGIKFGFLYTAEYFAGFAVAAVMASLFLGGWTAWGLEEWVPGWMIFVAKVYLVFFIYIWSRGTLPRLRIDQLMAFAWKFLLPLALLNVVLVGGEVLVWQEGGYEAEVVLPIFAAVNWAVAGALVVLWGSVLGHLRPERRPRRAVLMKEVGVIIYGQPEPGV